jgi:hypothetical protein
VAPWPARQPARRCAGCADLNVFRKEAAYAPRLAAVTILSFCGLAGRGMYSATSSPIWMAHRPLPQVGVLA